MKIVAIVQARMGSTRLPNKVMKEIGGKPMIELLLQRLSRAKRIDEIVLATSDNENNIPLIEFVSSLGSRVFTGSENDVLERYVKASDESAADVVVRITGDCPLVDPGLVDEVIEGFIDSGSQYFSNIDPATYPDGLDIEVFHASALRKAYAALEGWECQHVTLRTAGLGVLHGRYAVCVSLHCGRKPSLSQPLRNSPAHVRKQ